MRRARCDCCGAFMGDILGDGRFEIRDAGPVPSYFVALCWTCAAALRPVVEEWVRVHVLNVQAADVGGQERAP